MEGEINMEKTNNRHFIEVETEEEANKVDMTKYRFERFSEKRDKYIFVRRA
jgi:hypothetical protein